MATGSRQQTAIPGLRRLSLALPNRPRSPLNNARQKRRYSVTYMDRPGSGDVPGGGPTVGNPSTGNPSTVGNQVRRRSISGEDDEADLDFLAELKDQALMPIKEDLTEWLNKTLDIDIRVDNFMETLDNGVDICRLLKIIEEKARSSVENGEYKEKLPSYKISYKSHAKSNTWFARDNTANFIKWCKEYGIKSECVFETEGLVLHRDPRAVILCLYELARLGAKFGLDPPSLVSLEREIDREESGSAHSSSSGSGVTGVTGGGAKRTNQVATPARGKRKGSASSAGGGNVKGEKLDTEVHKVVGSCKCKQPYVVSKVSAGRYNINGRSMFVRLLKGRHVMVRVGGGWDTLEHYLVTHDPCKITEFRRGMAAGDQGKYLHIRGKYRST